MVAATNSNEASVCAVRRASGYLKEAGIVLRHPATGGGLRRQKPAIEVITDSGARENARGRRRRSCLRKTGNVVTTDFGAEVLATAQPPRPTRTPGRSPSASACAPYRDTIEVGLSPGAATPMAIWQDLWTCCGFNAGYHKRAALRKESYKAALAGSLRGHRDRAR